ncbi:class I SAM-dependent methyltransferase [soil metagenome]
MYSPFQLVKKYLHYYFHASNGKGHGVHSPFVFDFIKNVLNDKSQDDFLEEIESLRKELLASTKIIDVADFGAGSSVIKTAKRPVNKIAASSLKHVKYAQLLYRIVHHYKPGTIIELGTSFGISTSYMAHGNKLANIYTMEGAPTIAAIARDNFEKLGLTNIQLWEGDFGATLAPLLSGIKKIDLAFIDGNHRKEPTLEYFSQLINSVNDTGIIIFDDIHWSEGMEEAWATIQQHPGVTLSIDLFFIGLVFINPDFKVKQEYQIRF